MNATRFRTVSLDVDSTLAGIEGIDWLAARRGPELADEISALTQEAMSGRVAIDAVYARRLDAVAPTRSDVDALARAYRDAVAPGARECVAALQRGGVRVIVVSGGLRDALLSLAGSVGVPDADVYGVEVRFGANGTYAGFDADSPLTANDGKARVLQSLAGSLPRPILHVGDGVTDAVTRGVADGFAAFTGFATRNGVVAHADFTVDSFGALRKIVLGEQ